MIKILYHLFNVSAIASPGTGHSHGAEGDSGSQMVGIILIVGIAIAVFFFLSKKK
jgi:hypothetical protein